MVIYIDARGKLACDANIWRAVSHATSWCRCRHYVPLHMVLGKYPLLLQDINEVTKKQCVTFEKTTKGRAVGPEEAEQDGKLMELVREQTDQWTQLMNAQRRTRWDLTKADNHVWTFFMWNFLLLLI